MLALLGALTAIVLLALILSGILSPLVALIVVPVAAALLGGFGLGTGEFITAGVSVLAPVTGMFVFAILASASWRTPGCSTRPSAASCARSACARPASPWARRCWRCWYHLDGSGAACFLITIPAMLPLCDKLGMDRRGLACAPSALKVPVTAIFQPMTAVQPAGLPYVLAVAWRPGRREERRLGLSAAAARALPVAAEVHADLGGQPIEVAQAALIGQTTVGFPVSPLTPATFLVAGLAGIELRAHQLLSIPWLFGASLMMALVAAALGVLPI